MNRRWLLAGGLVGLLATGAAVAVLTPWQVLPTGAPTVRPDVAAVFTPHQVERVRRFRAAIGGWPYAAIAASASLPWLVVAASGWRRGRRPGGEPGLAVVTGGVTGRLRTVPADASLNRPGTPTDCATDCAGSCVAGRATGWVAHCGSVAGRAGCVAVGPTAPDPARGGRRRRHRGRPVARHPPPGRPQRGRAARLRHLDPELGRLAARPGRGAPGVPGRGGAGDAPALVADPSGSTALAVAAGRHRGGRDGRRLDALPAGCRVALHPGHATAGRTAADQHRAARGARRSGRRPGGGLQRLLPHDW